MVAGKLQCCKGDAAACKGGAANRDYTRNPWLTRRAPVCSRPSWLCDPTQHEAHTVDCDLRLELRCSGRHHPPPNPTTPPPASPRSASPCLCRGQECRRAGQKPCCTRGRPRPPRTNPACSLQQGAGAKTGWTAVHRRTSGWRLAWQAGRLACVHRHGSGGRARGIPRPASPRLARSPEYSPTAEPGGTPRCSMPEPTALRTSPTSAGRQAGQASAWVSASTAGRCPICNSMCTLLRFLHPPRVTATCKCAPHVGSGLPLGICGPMAKVGALRGQRGTDKDGGTHCRAGFERGTWLCCSQPRRSRWRASTDGTRCTLRAATFQGCVVVAETHTRHVSGDEAHPATQPCGPAHISKFCDAALQVVIQRVDVIVWRLECVHQAVRAERTPAKQREDGSHLG